MRWHVALAMGLVAWGTYSLTRARSTSRHAELDSKSSGNGSSRRDAAASGRVQESQTPAVATQPSEDSNKSTNTSTLIRVSWKVRVPEGTPANAPIYICGNHPALGHWNPMGVAMRPAGRLLYQGDLYVPAGTSFEYKYTRGSWASVEVLKNRAHRPNRLLDLHRSVAIDDDIEAWADQF